jgi:hypothetical protein
MLKLGVQYLSPFIVMLINVCVQTGMYPDLLKISRITPIYKSGPKNCISNYRPISILKNLNKIFEKYLQKRLVSFFDRCNLFSVKQHGFKSGCSTETALLQFISSVLPAFENKTFSLAVFLDFKKAFNCMDKDILLQKLEIYGVRGIVLDLMRSYLENRPQKVQYGGKISEVKYINVGIPQGSCIGPILYNIYTNDLDEFIADIFKVFYADDTAVTTCHINLEMLKDTIAGVLTRVEQWCAFNKLALSATKTKAVLFTNCNTDPPQLCIDNVPIEFISHYKYLGINIDSRLKFNAHLNELKIKLSRNCGISYRLQSKLNLDSAKNLYYSFTYSAISYCICVYGGLFLCSERGNKIKKLQKRIILNLFCPHYRNLSFSEILQREELLKVEDIYKLQVGCYMYKILYLNDYQFLKDYICPAYPDHGYNTRINDFILPFPRVENIRINFKYQFLNVWNQVPVDIKTSNSLQVFKRNYKKYLINLYT